MDNIVLKVSYIIVLDGKLNEDVPIEHLKTRVKEEFNLELKEEEIKRALEEIEENQIERELNKNEDFNFLQL